MAVCWAAGARRRLAGLGGAGWLIMVGAGYALVQVLVFVLADGWAGGLGWDETIYVSQVSPYVPTEYFSAPRARGVTLLVAPVAAVTASLPALRVFMMAVSAVLLVVAYWPWLGVLPGRRAVGIAALLLAGLWIVQYHGDQVMPNLYVAFAALAAVGWFVRAHDGGGPGRGRRRALVGLGVSLAAMTLLRPPDAAFLTTALLGASMACRPRRPAVVGVITGGALAGLVPWLVEAFVSFGGPLNRLRLADRTEGGMGWHPEAIGMQLRALNGPLLCRPCTVGWRYPALSLWWLALPLLLVAALWVARRVPGPDNRGERSQAVRVVVLTIVCGAALAVPYLVMTPYAAPRFLIATYALWSIPVAVAVSAALAPSTGSSGFRHPILAPVVVMLVVVHLAAQLLVLQHRVADQARSRDAVQALAAHLGRLGITPPCVIAGDEAPMVAFYARCASAATATDNPAATHQTLLTLGQSRPVAVLSRSARWPAFLPGWHRALFAPLRASHWHIRWIATAGGTSRRPARR